jgi:hypothetical protein
VRIRSAAQADIRRPRRANPVLNEITISPPFRPRNPAQFFKTVARPLAWRRFANKHGVDPSGGNINTNALRFSDIAAVPVNVRFRGRPQIEFECVNQTCNSVSAKSRESQ